MLTSVCQSFVVLLQNAKGVRQLENVSPDGLGRNKTLNQCDFLKLKIPLPSLKVQQEIVALLETIDEGSVKWGVKGIILLVKIQDEGVYL